MNTEQAKQRLVGVASSVFGTVPEAVTDQHFIQWRAYVERQEAFEKAVKELLEALDQHEAHSECGFGTPLSNAIERVSRHVDGDS